MAEQTVHREEMATTVHTQGENQEGSTWQVELSACWEANGPFMCQRLLNSSLEREDTPPVGQ